MWHWNRKYKSTTVFTMQKSLSRLPSLPGPQTSAWRSIHHLQMKAHTASKKAHSNLCSLVFTPSCHPSSWGEAGPGDSLPTEYHRGDGILLPRLDYKKLQPLVSVCLRETLGELTALLKTALSETHVARNWSLPQPTASEEEVQPASSHKSKLGNRCFHPESSLKGNLKIKPANLLSAALWERDPEPEAP